VGRVIAVDAIGMGRSDKPDLPYSYFLQVGFLERFLDEVGIRRAAFVAHDFGVCLALSVAMRRPDLVGALAMLEPIGVNRAVPPEHRRTEDPPWRGPLMEVVNGVRDPERGPGLVMDENVYQAKVVPILTARTLSEAEMAGYTSAYPDPESRRVQRMWPLVFLGREDELLGNLTEFEAFLPFLQRSTVPRLVVYNSSGLVSTREVEWLAANVPGLEAVYLGEGQHFIQEDNTDALGRTLRDWLQSPALRASLAASS
jgi:haloalkane dehalogenase